MIDLISLVFSCRSKCRIYTWRFKFIFFLYDGVEFALTVSSRVLLWFHHGSSRAASVKLVDRHLEYHKYGLTRVDN